jgi:hypothetical protein
MPVADELPGVECPTFTVAVAERGGRQRTVGAACCEDVAFALFRAVAAEYPEKTVILLGVDRVRELAVRS